MKKTFCVLLCLSLLAIFVSCVGGEQKTSSPSESQSLQQITWPTQPSEERPTLVWESESQTEPLSSDSENNVQPDEPTEALTSAPTDAPTKRPTNEPTLPPTEAPTDLQTVAPTDAPTTALTEESTEKPTDMPSDEPTEEKTDAPTDEPTNAPTDEPTDAPTDEYDLYDAIFDIENKVELFLDIEEEELWKIQADYEKYTVEMDGKSPIYRKADLIVRLNGEEMRIEEVGFRMKGDDGSRRDFYGEDGYINAIHFKLSFDETFDDVEYYGDEAKVWTDTLARDERKQRTFATLEELDLKWFKNHDSTHVREYYAYEMMRSYGVLAPQTNVASVDFNETHMGLFQIIESIDEIFIERNLPAKDWGGDLYKADYVNGRGGTYELSCTYGVEDKAAGISYNYNLKTNKKKSTHASLKNLLTVLNKEDLTQEEFEAVVDRDYFINFAAATFAIGNPDEMRHVAKNYYVYFLKSTGKAVFIIHDCDRVFGLLCGWNPSGNGMTDVNPFHTGFRWNSSLTQPSKMYTETICVKDGDYSGWYLREYAEKLKEIYLSDWFNHNTFMRVYNIARTHYQNLAVPSVDFVNMTEERQVFSLNDVNRDIEAILAVPGQSAVYNIPMSTFIGRVKKNMIPYIDEVLAILDAQ